MITIRAIHYKSNFCEVELDTGETLIFGLDSMFDLSLSKDETIDEVKYQYLKEESEKFQSFTAGIRYLAPHIRSEKEMRTYLTRKGFSKQAIDTSINKLEHLGYLNDAEYAARFIEYKTKRKQVGSKFLESELIKKGIDRKIIRTALKDSRNDQDNVDEAIAAARKKLPSLEGKTNQAAKLYGFLARRGFSHDTISRAVNILLPGTTQIE